MTKIVKNSRADYGFQNVASQKALVAFADNKSLFSSSAMYVGESAAPHKCSDNTAIVKD